MLKCPPITMCALSASQLEKVLHLIDSDHSNYQISSLTGHSTATISCLWSKHHPHIPKSSGGRPSKLSQTNIRHAVCLINSGKADNATQITHSLQSITNQSLSRELSAATWKWLVWKLWWRRNALCFPGATELHAWTLRQVTETGPLMTGWGQSGLMRSNSIVWAQMGRNGCGRELGKVSLIALLRGPWSLVGFSYDVGLYDLGGGWVCMQDWWEDGCRPVLPNPGRRTPRNPQIFWQIPSWCHLPAG